MERWRRDGGTNVKELPCPWPGFCILEMSADEPGPYEGIHWFSPYKELVVHKPISMRGKDYPSSFLKSDGSWDFKKWGGSLGRVGYTSNTGWYLVYQKQENEYGPLAP